MTGSGNDVKDEGGSHKWGCRISSKQIFLKDHGAWKGCGVCFNLQTKLSTMDRSIIFQPNKLALMRNNHSVLWLLSTPKQDLRPHFQAFIACAWCQILKRGIYSAQAWRPSFQMDSMSSTILSFQGGGNGDSSQKWGRVIKQHKEIWTAQKASVFKRSLKVL